MDHQRLSDTGSGLAAEADNPITPRAPGPDDSPAAGTIRGDLDEAVVDGPEDESPHERSANTSTANLDVPSDSGDRAAALSGGTDAHDEPAEPLAPTVHPRWPRAVLVTALFVIVADQLTKWWALERLSNGRLIDVIGSLRFNLAFNTGTAFSLGSGLGPFIAVVAVVISLALVWTARSVLKTSSLLAVGLVVGGALGNFIDRAFRPPRFGNDSSFLGGAVVDFIDVQWWPIFNIADAGIVVGGILIVLLGGFGPPPEPKASKASKAGG